MTSQKAQHKKQKTGITTTKNILSWKSEAPPEPAVAGMNLLRWDIPTASMPLSRSPDISRQMLLSMSRLHIRWYSLNTVNEQRGFSSTARGGTAMCWMASLQRHFSAGHYSVLTLVWTSQGLILCYQPFTCFHAPSSLPRSVLFIKGLDQESSARERVAVLLRKLQVSIIIRKYSGSHTHPFPPYKYLTCQQHNVKFLCSY